MNVAIIPARGGSKRIPRKNIRDFCGKPILTWSIEVAQESGCFQRIIVSTDDPEIACIAREAGAETPFTRPSSLADDQSSTAAVIAHALTFVAASDQNNCLACCIYPTAPLLDPATLRGAGELLASTADADYAVSVVRFDHPVQRALRIDSNGRVSMRHPEHLLSRSQDLEPFFHDAGQFYWGRPEAWQRMAPIFSERTIPVPLAASRVQDIDSPEDWCRAEALFSWLRRSQ